MSLECIECVVYVLPAVETPSLYINNIRKASVHG